ncbi:hypothetical protein J2X72_003903 [Phyllobacterium sp. 1468]|uniref:DUF982 domain-containing protein n=1 Tax=Phyllobacterium sp. 1468 TaxID=2817759 RepID=UPI00286500F6|nr:DUF982 domain-containing protein [Phyllobacterium sp. 1468]MDR6635091.1 hypothetical protein [Phyllobacterium sp. 1468]
MESQKPLCFSTAMAEDYKAFAPVTVLTNRPGQMLGIGTAYDAAKFVVEEWPAERGGPKLSDAKVILLQCLSGQCSPAIARVAFIEAARESHIYIVPPENEPVRSRPKWQKAARAWRRS